MICDADDGGVLLREDLVGGGGEPWLSVRNVMR